MPVFCLALLGAVMALHMLCWFLVKHCRDSLPDPFINTFDNVKFHKTPYLRTLCALFVFTCKAYNMLA